MAETPNFTNIHFIGIGGAGMSSIALVFHQRGQYVSGSDLKNSNYVRDLKAVGIDVHIGHDGSLIDEKKPDVVVVSSAIPKTNPELIRARELGIPVWPRAQMLAALSVGATTVAIAGTHGKTTTSSMVATMLDHLGCDPSFLIGGKIEEYATNGRNGNGGYFVCEADESDGSFLYLYPDIVVVTNIEADHLDHYGTLENIEKTFCEFMSLVGDKGTIVIYGDVARYVELARSTKRRVVTYGFNEGVDYRCLPKGSTHQLESHFAVLCPDGHTYQMSLAVNPGRHNMANATAALAVAGVLGLDLKRASEAISGFQGVHRRFTYVGEARGITVVDDYGHHPTEIAATLRAARDLQYKRLVCVFQPHRYSRTQALAEQFGHAFDDADVLYVLDVFSAGEVPIPGISGKTIANSVKKVGTVPTVCYIRNRRKLLGRLERECREGDIVITQGAGDITQFGPALLAALSEHNDG